MNTKNDTEHDLSALAKAAGVSVRDLETLTGMSNAGVRKCLIENRLPLNRVVAARWRAALNMEIQQ